MRTRQWGRLLIATVIIGAMAMIGASAVSAHARPTASDPADKATVNKAPTQVSITFSEETNPTKSGGSVTDASGATVSTGFKVDLNERTKMTIDLKPNLPNGAYTVKWNSFTDNDNGVADGTFTFTIQAAATGTATTVAQAATTPAATTAPAATVAPTTAPATVAATVAPTATRAATTPAATGTGGGTAATTTAPATLPKTGNSDGGSANPPWAIVILVAAALAVGCGLLFRFRSAHR